MNVLVTGCAGFIGSNVARELLNLGHSVQGVDNFTDSNLLRLQQWRLNDLVQNPRFTLNRIDIVDEESLRPMLLDTGPPGPVEAVVNLAARAGVRESVENPRAYYQVNLMGTLNLLDLCREFGARRFILASTSSVYGAQTDGPVAEDAPAGRPLSPYAASKIAAETLLHSYHQLHGIDAAVLRFFTVYGPAGRLDMAVFRFIRAIAEGEAITVYGDGNQQRDFTYVDDVARGVAAALTLKGYEIINLGNDRPVALNSVIHLIEEETGRPARIRYQERHPADPLVTWADIGHARELLGWSPVIGIEEGIRRTVAWYQENREWARDLT